MRPGRLLEQLTMIRYDIAVVALDFQIRQAYASMLLLYFQQDDPHEVHISPHAVAPLLKDWCLIPSARGVPPADSKTTRPISCLARHLFPLALGNG